MVTLATRLKTSTLYEFEFSYRLDVNKPLVFCRQRRVRVGHAAHSRSNP